MSKQDRTIVNFYNRNTPIRTCRTTFMIPNVAVGQIFCFDHPQMAKSLNGKVYNIQHVVYLGNEAPITYIDVEVES